MSFVNINGVNKQVNQDSTSSIGVSDILILEFKNKIINQSSSDASGYYYFQINTSYNNKTFEAYFCQGDNAFKTKYSGTISNGEGKLGNWTNGPGGATGTISGISTVMVFIK